MNEKSAKPPEEDPDATVTSISRADLLKAPDEDATVMMTSRKVLEEPRAKGGADEDATVMMPRKALEEPAGKGGDDDATVMMSRSALISPEPEPDPDATVTISAASLKGPAPEEAAGTAPSAATGAPAAATTAAAAEAGSLAIAAQPSKMPMIAGAAVVVLVVLYYLMGGDKPAAPVAPPAPQAQAPAPTPAPAATSSPATSAPAATPVAPVTTSAPAAPVAAAAPAPATPAAGGAAKLGELLAGDIKRGSISVTNEGGGATITFNKLHQFASGGVDPEGEVRPLLLSVAAALDKVPGSIVVIGHADATPSSNAKYPSNQALSAARAASAAKLIAGKLSDPKRVSSEGASDSKPVAPSDTADNRAKNRRVVVVLKPA